MKAIKLYILLFFFFFFLKQDACKRGHATIDKQLGNHPPTIKEWGNSGYVVYGILACSANRHPQV
jgi:hypothetical protein